MSEPFTIPKPPHGSNEWLAARWMDPSTGEKLVPASLAAAMWNQHEFVTDSELAAMMLAPEPPVETDPTEPQDRGQRLEPVIAEWWADRRGLRVVEADVLYRRGRCVSTIDRVIVGVVDRHLEVKSWNGYWRGVLSPQWHWQGVTQAYTRGTACVEWAILDASLRLHFYTQHVTDEDFIDLEQRVEWWCAFIDLGMIPEGITMSYRDVTTLHPDVTIAKCELPDEALEWVTDLAAIRAQMKALEQAEDEVKARLGIAMGDAEHGLVSGVEVVTWSRSERTTFDSKRFQKADPDTWAQYAKTTPVRTMRVVGEAE